jgi:ribosome biogenesis GTPase
VRAHDARGRHATTHRELLRLPGGALLIDTPGLRELQLWAAPDALEGAFAEVEALAASCRFGDCRHAGEPGCAVAGAAAAGTLDPSRLESYRKLQRELRHLALRHRGGSR